MSHAVTVTPDPGLLPSSAPSPPPLWRFLLPLLLQLGIVIWIPAPQVITLLTGTTIYLKTVPMDPYDLLRGRYVTLNYAIAQPSLLEKLPGWSDQMATQNSSFYIVIAPPPKTGDPTHPWQAVAVSQAFPDPLQPGHQVIKARYQTWQADLGLCAYYIPEAVGDGLEEDIRQHQEKTRVQAKVDRRGNAALVHIWVEDRVY